MPTIGESSEDGRQAGALEDIADRLALLVKAKRAKESLGWTFTVHRDKEGFISTVTCEPNGNH